MKKVLTLLGSPHAKGNTATSLGFVEETLRSKGHAVERIHVARKNIAGCLACHKCQSVPDEIACVQKDDGIPVMQAMIDADLIIVATPIYMWGMTAQMKALIDRSYALITEFETPAHTSLIKGTPIALLHTGGGEYLDNAEVVSIAFGRFVKGMLGVNAGELFIGECLNLDEKLAEMQERGSVFGEQLLKYV